MIRRKDATIPVLALRRHKIGEPLEGIKRREFDDAARLWPRGLSRAAQAVATQPAVMSRNRTFRSIAG